MLHTFLLKAENLCWQKQQSKVLSLDIHTTVSVAHDWVRAAWGVACSGVMSVVNPQENGHLSSVPLAHLRQFVLCCVPQRGLVVPCGSGQRSGNIPPIASNVWCLLLGIWSGRVQQCKYKQVTEKREWEPTFFVSVKSLLSMEWRSVSMWAHRERVVA